MRKVKCVLVVDLYDRKVLSDKMDFLVDSKYRIGIPRKDFSKCKELWIEIEFPKTE